MKLSIMIVSAEVFILPNDQDEPRLKRARQVRKQLP